MVLLVDNNFGLNYPDEVRGKLDQLYCDYLHQENKLLCYPKRQRHWHGRFLFDRFFIPINNEDFDYWINVIMNELESYKPVN
jgi:hypothetical protein